MTNPTPQPPASDMTLRDWFAGKALSGMLGEESALKALAEASEEKGIPPAKVAAFTCYVLADAMMEARKV